MVVKVSPGSLVLWLHKFVFLLSFSPVKITQTILNTFHFQDQLLRPFKVLNFVTEHLLKYNIIEYIIHPHPFVTITNTFISITHFDLFSEIKLVCLSLDLIVLLLEQDELKLTAMSRLNSWFRSNSAGNF